MMESIHWSAGAEDQPTPFYEEPEPYLAHLKAAIEKARRDIEELKKVSQPDFASVVVALETAQRQLNHPASVIFNLNQAHTSPALQQVAQEASQALTAFGNDVLLDETLFALVKAVAEDAPTDLNAAEARLLDKSYKSFARNGAQLSEADKTRLREINLELSGLSLKFGEQLLADTNAFSLHLTEAKDLGGLPEPIAARAKAEAESRGLEGWVFTLQYPSYLPFMTYADSRKLRERMFRAFATKGLGGNEFDNRETIMQIVKLRDEKAKMLGYPHYAAYVLEERMAKSADKVFAFLEDLWRQSSDALEEELNDLRDFALQIDGLEELQRWDLAYYAEKLKKHRFDISDEDTKPYFQLEKVVEGVFQVAARLYGLTFKPVSNVPVYHEDVRVFEVEDRDGNYLALFYADFFPRATKKDGAWKTTFRQQYMDEAGNHRPHVSIVCNFTPPSGEMPSLLTFREVQTLFHEFGHALHAILSQCQFESQSGTNVAWDFVELPSQIMENWCFEPDCLALFAQHYETGEVIPDEMVLKLKEAANFQAAYQMVRQVSIAMLDMAWHTTPPDEITDVIDFEKSVVSRFDVMPEVPDTGLSGSFSHIFQGGYAAGYYSYKWAEVLDADAYELFVEKGIFDQEVASAFEQLLSSGDSADAMELYEQFRGRKPDPKALMRRSGLAE